MKGKRYTTEDKIRILGEADRGEKSIQEHGAPEFLRSDNGSVLRMTSEKPSARMGSVTFNKSDGTFDLGDATFEQGFPVLIVGGDVLDVGRGFLDVGEALFDRKRGCRIQKQGVEGGEWDKASLF